MSEVNNNPAVQEPTPGAGAEKTFTQAEVDALIGKRVSAAMKKMPGEEELAAFHTWKNSQQTEQEKWQKLNDDFSAAQQEKEAALSELEQYKREKYLLTKGVKAEDADYYSFKAGKLVTDSMTFEQAVDELLKDKQPNTVTVVTAAPVGGSSAANTTNDQMNALLRGARK